MRSVDSFPGNLPVQLSSFIGRSAEVQATIKALGESRAVTLTGVGGVGKPTFGFAAGRLRAQLVGLLAGTGSKLRGVHGCESGLAV